MNKENHLGLRQRTQTTPFCSASLCYKYLYLRTEKTLRQKDNHLARLTQALTPAKVLELA